MIGCSSDKSNLYNKYFINGNVDYLGRVFRFSNLKSTEVANRSFVRYCVERGLSLPTEYRMVQPNLDASFKSISKYDKAQPSLENSAWIISGEWTTKHFFPYMSGSRVLDRNLVLSEMDMTTSCGYPANLQFHTKREFLGMTDEFKHLSVLEYMSSATTLPIQVGILNDYWDLIGTDNVDNIVPIWTCSQKVELRLVTKLDENKIRTFTASPIEHSVSTNRLCLDMNNKFYASANKTWSFVGGTKFLQGWHSLYCRLHRLPNAFELDESEYDSSLFAAAMLGQIDIRWEMLASEHKTPENRKRLEAIYASIVHSVIVLENGELIQKHTGNPSGSSNTIVDNTMILFRLFAYAWIKCCMEIKRAISYLDFMTEVEAALNGDDNTFTVSDAVVGWFNPRSIAKIWSAIGVTTNTPCWEPQTLDKVTFLSQGFNFDKRLSLWLPVPATARVLGTLYLGSKVDDVRFHLLRANALRLDSYGNEYCRKIIADYIVFLYANYQDDFVGSVSLKKASIPMAEINALWKSDLFIEALYSGHESGVVDSVLEHVQSVGEVDARDPFPSLQVVNVKYISLL
jgi:hypothetical protein